MVGAPGGGGTSGNIVADFFVAVGEFISKVLSKKVAGFTVKSILTTAFVAMGVRNFQQMRDLMSKGQEILATKVAQGGKIPVIYGSRRVGSTVVFLDTADNRSKDLFVVYALSVGEVDEIQLDSIELDGNPITDTKRFRQGYYAGSDKISSGAGSLNTVTQVGDVQNSNAGTSGTDPTKRYRMVFNAHHGAASQSVDPMLNASLSTKWTSAHKLNGIAYIAASYEFDTKAMFKGIPQLTVIVKGKKVYDPRLDGSISGGTGSHRLGTTSTYEWSDNPALCLLDYMTNDEYGKGLGSSVLDLQSFQTAADAADTLKDTPDYLGSYSSTTWSSTSGARRVVVDATTWNETKVGGTLTIRDGDANIVFDGCTVIGKQRYHTYDETADYIIWLDCAATSTQSNISGTSLNKVRRFSCNGVLDPGVSVLENARELLANMRGILNYNQGKYELKLEDTASSAFTVTSDHIIEDAGIQVTYESKDKKANKVVVEYFNASKGFELDTVTVYHDPNDDGTFTDYKDDDGGEELELKVNFPYIVNPYVAYNMGLAILKRSRNQKTVSFLATPELYKVNVGDVITVDYSPVGSPSGLYRVEAMDLLPNGLISVNAIQYLDIYTWDDPSAENVEALINLPQTHAVKAPTGLTFTDTNSSSTGRPFLSWNEPTDFPNYEYRVNIVDSSSNQLMNRIVDVEFVDLNFLPTGNNYVASVTSINSIGSESDATTLTFNVSAAPVDTGDVADDAITLDKIASDVQSAIDAGGANSTQLIKSTSAPTTRSDSSSLQAQDIWIDTDDNNQAYVRNAANNGWVKARDSSLVTLVGTSSFTGSTLTSAMATAQSDISTVTTDTSSNTTSISNLTSTVNAKTQTFIQTSAPTAVATGDLWIDSDDDNKLYRWNGSSWISVRDTANDGQATIFTQTSAPTANNTGDLWFDTDDSNKQYRWNGSSWVAVRDVISQASITTNSTAIADLEGNAQASYVLQLNANGKVAQMILASNADAGTGATSTIAFLADTFKIDNDAGSSVSPFVVTGGTVYIDNARITGLQASNIAANTLTSASGVIGTLSGTDITIENLNADNINTGTLNANRIQIDNVTLDTDINGNLIIATDGVDTTQLATDAVTTTKVTNNSISGFIAATGSQYVDYNDNYPDGSASETRLGYAYQSGTGSGGSIYSPNEAVMVETGIMLTPSAGNTSIMVIGHTINNVDAASSSDLITLRLQYRLASTSGGVSSANYSDVRLYTMYGASAESFQTITGTVPSSFTYNNYYYQFRLTMRAVGVTTLAGTTRTYGSATVMALTTVK